VKLEYSNPNYVSAPDLHAVLRGWGAMEPLVVSHGRSRLRYGKWPAIACIATAVADPSNGEFRFAFRLTDAGRTMRLTPVRNVEWSADRQKMVRRSGAEELEDLRRRLHIFDVRSEVTADQIQTTFTDLGYDGCTVLIQPGRWWGVVMLRDEQAAVRLDGGYGVHRSQRILIGNSKLFVNPPAEDGGLRCFNCAISGHISREC
ncbi:hypothetical protein PHMEG_00038390, partial [Phytophthora megakarya]